MRKLVLIVGFPLLAALALGAAAPSKAKVHGFALSGTIVSLDNAKRTLVVRGASGKETPLVWTSATSVFGGKLETGQAVTLRYLDRDGKHVATSIRVAQPVTPRPVPTPTPIPPHGG